MPPVLPCIACSSVLTPDRWGGPNDGDRIAYCPACGLGRLVDPPHSDELVRHYSTDLYAAETPRAWPIVKSLHRALNRRLLQRLGPPAGRLLDVGAGRGHLLAAAIDLALAGAALPGARGWAVLAPGLGQGASLQVVARVRAAS